jgi:arginine-tRNA-protein transferase
MKVFDTTICLNKITLKEFDDYLAKGYFPSQQELNVSTHKWNIHVDDDEVHVINKLTPFRYVAEKVVLHKSQMRISKRNKYFRVEITDFNKITSALNEIYRKYIKHVTFHCNSGLKYKLGLNNKDIKSVFTQKVISIYNQDKLIAADIIYVGKESIASIICIYDPEYSKYSLGKYTMMMTIEYMKQNCYKYYYPGEMINGNDKNNYKLFLGIEAAYVYDFENEFWVKFNPSV